jgi:hypothetical protein
VLQQVASAVEVAASAAEAVHVHQVVAAALVAVAQVAAAHVHRVEDDSIRDIIVTIVSIKETVINLKTQQI